MDTAKKRSSSESSPQALSDDGPRLVIFDARSKSAAAANRSRGGGFENSSFYNASLEFLGMENIHSIRGSYQKLKRICSGFNTASLAPPGRRGVNSGFLGLLEGTEWLVHTQRIVWGAVKIVRALETGASCLVHCSDGWDRTPQLTATAMLLIDPYYRSIDGFVVLVESQWVQFGHKFADRCGLALGGAESAAAAAAAGASDENFDDRSPVSAGSPKLSSNEAQEISPIFVQWIDAVYQILRQFPTAFEFTSRVLLLLIDAVHGGRYGTFLGNNCSTRTELGLPTRTVSFWTDFRDMLSDPASSGELVNRGYRPHENVLWPSSNAKRLLFWEEFYLRHDGDHLHLEVTH
eukprot:NODE_2353_length_1222_cov_49.555840_g2147_i0.p1 GENE.NODE_2353_length_1222_cov_49.555840_g2147_i0~~NODE_2353_length_1222_cov_49.555840_g2147_i0.p1  ORF type:complete len:379 (+),score=69.65 NODE_2353_length_1222_cov_49.555840_g2147_i0:91-1137(+)